MLSSVGVWQDTDDLDEYDVLLVFKDDIDDFLYYLENGLIVYEKTIFEINAKQSFLNIALRYLEYKYNFKFKESSNDGDEIFFNNWEQLINNNKYLDFKSAAIPDCLHKADRLLEIVNKALSFRHKLLTYAPTLGARGVEFTHNWWDFPPKIISEVSDFIYELKKKRDRHSVYLSLYSYLSECLTEIGKIKRANPQYLMISSAFCFSAGRYSLHNGEYDKSLLLLHRCVDLYFQHIAKENGLVTECKDGLMYTSISCNRDVNLQSTKEKLLDGIYLSLSADLNKKIDRINFLRNRCILTHSFFSIKKEEIEKQFSFVYEFISSVEGEPNEWRKSLRKIIRKPDIKCIDLFDFEDSFDVFIKKRQ